MKVSKRAVRHVVTKRNGNSEHSVVRVRQLLENLINEVDCLEEVSLALDAVSPLDYGEGIDFYQEVQRFETGLIRKAMRRTHGSQIEAARLLGLLPSTLNMKLRRYHLLPTLSEPNGRISEFPTMVRNISGKRAEQLERNDDC